MPLAVGVSAGQRHDSTLFEDTMYAARFVSTEWPQWLLGDKAYSNHRIRDWLWARNVEAVIAHPSNQRTEGDDDEFDRDRYRQRNVVERCVGWLKECRRIATRFEKLAVNFVAMLEVAMIQRYLRLLDAS